MRANLSSLVATRAQTIPSLSERVLGRPSHQANRDFLPLHLDGTPPIPSSSSFASFRTTVPVSPRAPLAPTTPAPPSPIKTTLAKWFKSEKTSVEQPPQEKPKKESGMITLAMVRPTGNSSAGEFPYYGRFGIDTVRVVGKVRTGIDERASGRPPLVAAVFVQVIRRQRCYEEYEEVVVALQRLWSPLNGAVTGVLGQQEFDFDLSVPRETLGTSGGAPLANVDSEVKTSWKVEAFATLDEPGLVVEGKQSLPVRLRRIGTRSINSLSSGPLSWTPEFSISPPPFDYTIQVPNKPFSFTSPLDVVVSFTIPPTPSSREVRINTLSFNLVRTLTRQKKTLRTESFDFRQVTASLPTSSDPSADSSSITGTIREKSRTPSPPLPPSANRLEIVSRPDKAVTFEHRFVFRLGQGRWSCGETADDELEFYRMTFKLNGLLTYKTRNSSSKHVETFQDRPVHVVGTTSAEELARRPAPQNPLLPALVLRRASDINSLRTISRPSTPSALVPEGERRGSAAFLPLPSTDRPQSGRRLSAHSEAIAQPAPTRARRSPPAPIAVPALEPSSVTRKGFSRSSTVETLGPDTPNTMEFLASAPVASSSRGLHPSVTSSSPGLPPLSPSAANGHHRSARAPRGSLRHSRDIRPRSSGSSRSTSAFSVASFASTASLDDAKAPGTPTFAPLVSEDGLPGLSLADTAFPPALQASGIVRSVVDEDAVMSCSPDLSSTSPPSSPEPSFSSPEPAIKNRFSDPFARSSSPFVAVVSDSNRPASRDMYVSPRQAPNDTVKPASNIGSQVDPSRSKSPSKAPSVVTFKNTASPPLGAGQLTSPRKASIVADFFSRIARRSSKVVQ